MSEPGKRVTISLASRDTVTVQVHRGTVCTSAETGQVIDTDLSLCPEVVLCLGDTMSVVHDATLPADSVMVEVRKIAPPTEPTPPPVPAS